MNKSIFTMFTLTLLTIPAISDASELIKGPYVSGFIGVSALKDAELETSGYDRQLDEYYGSKNNVKFDKGVFIGGTGGYDFGMIRLEGELSYKYNEIDTINDWNPRYYYLADEVGTFAFMGNVFIDLHNDTPVTPYFGGGLGFATINLSNSNYDYYYDDEGDYDSVFAYQLGGGLEIALNKRFSLDVGYRYFVTDKAHIDLNSYYISQTSTIKLESHNVAIGVRFKF